MLRTLQAGAPVLVFVELYFLYLRKLILENSLLHKEVGILVLSILSTNLISATYNVEENIRKFRSFCLQVI